MKITHIIKRSQQITIGLIAILLSQTQAYAITPEEEAIPRIIELSQTQQPTQATIDEVLALAQEGSTNQMRQQFVWTALIQIGPSNSGDQYAKDTLDDAASPIRSKQGALGYLAEHPAPWMVPYAEQYIVDTFDGEARAMAAYLAGALNLSAQVDTIKSILSNSSYGDARQQAMYGLAKLIPSTEFTAFIDTTDLNQWDKTLAKQLNDFLQTDVTSKETKIPFLLRRSEMIFPLAAMQYMLESNNTELIKQYVVNGDESTINLNSVVYEKLLRILGYEITGNIDAIVITKKPLL